MGPVGQRDTKLLAVKVGGLKNKSAAGPSPSRTDWPWFDSDWVQIILKV